MACVLLMMLAQACQAAAGGPAATSSPTVISVGTPTSVIPATPSPTPQPTATTGEPGPAVTFGDARFSVEVVDTADRRAQGLSRRPALAQGTGMLFVFDTEAAYGFWMKEMQFPLDLVWISSQCAVVDVVPSAPPPKPGQTLAELAIYTPKAPALYVLEVNAGEAVAAGIMPGKRLALTGSLAGQYGC